MSPLPLETAHYNRQRQTQDTIRYDTRAWPYAAPQAGGLPHGTKNIKIMKKKQETIYPGIAEEAVKSP